MKYVGVDPAVGRGSAMAITWLDHTGNLDGSIVLKLSSKIPLEERLQEIVVAFQTVVTTVLQGQGLEGAVIVVEGQEWYPNSPHNPNHLITLATVAGALAALSQAYYNPVRLLNPLPKSV